LLSYGLTMPASTFEMQRRSDSPPFAAISPEGAETPANLAAASRFARFAIGKPRLGVQLVR